MVAAVPAVGWSAGAPAGAPVAVLAWHGTRAAAGRADTAALTAAVRAALPGVVVRRAYVDAQVQTPTLSDVLAEVLADRHTHAVVIPVFLAAGYHVCNDIPAAVAPWAGRVTVTSHLGVTSCGQPDSELVRGLCAAVDSVTGSVAGAAPAAAADTPRAVLLVSAGSTVPGAAAQMRRLAAAVGTHYPQSAVHACDLADGERAVTMHIRALQEGAQTGQHGRAAPTGAVAVVPVVLARGYFSARIIQVAQRAGTAVVLAPLLGHAPAATHVVRALASRYRAALPTCDTRRCIPVC